MKKVFLIDDDPVFVYLAQRMINTVDPSLEVRVYGDGELATIELNRNKGNPAALPDIILLDLNMPVMDGWQFLDYYASVLPLLSKAIALYIVSSTVSPDDIERSKQYPFVSDILIKPLEMDHLVRALSSPRT